MKHIIIENMNRDTIPDESKYDLTPEEYSYEVSCDPDHPFFVGEPDKATKRFYLIAIIFFAIVIIASIIFEDG